MTFTPDFKTAVESWKDENDYNNAFHAELAVRVNADPDLKSHRDFVESNQYGFGDRPFHYVWKMLVDQMPEEFSFLEIGVFKGQVISLIALLAKREKKDASIYGITTLSNTPDKRCQYPAGDYRAWISGIYKHFDLPLPVLWNGESTNPSVIAESDRMAFDVVYVDGNHDYEIVAHDIKTYGPKTKPGGFLVIDDSSNFLNIGTCWPGLQEVSQAVKDILEPDTRFKHLFACGHLRVFQRVDEPIQEVPFPEEAKSIKLDFSGPRWTPTEDVQLLIWLAKKTQGAILEIGCNEGRTTRELALTYPSRTIVGVDYSGPEDTLCPQQASEKPREYAIGLHAAMLSNVWILNRKSEALWSDPGGLTGVLRVGFIFIDADHSYRGVKKDSELALQIIAKAPAGSIIAWHDCYKDAPAWVGVRNYLLRELSIIHTIHHFEGTYIAYFQKP